MNTIDSLALHLAKVALQEATPESAAVRIVPILNDALPTICGALIGRKGGAARSEAKTEANRKKARDYWQRRRKSRL